MESDKKRAGNGHAEPGNVYGDKYAGLILAAGYSSRMGAFKPLLPIGDMTAIERVSAALKQAGIHSIIGVTGFQKELLSPIFASEGILEAYNPDFEQGMFTSIKTGIKKALNRLLPDLGRIKAPGAGLPEALDGFFLMPVDCPLVPPWVLEQILERHKEDPEALIVPCFRGKKGHPLFIPARYAEEILAYEGEGGLKAVTSRYEDRLIRLETGSEAVVLDMDTPEGYEEVLEYYERQLKRAHGPDGMAGACKSGIGKRGTGEADARLEEEPKGKRLFLIRHGEIRQHRGKIFLGQTDVPLSDTGKAQAAEAAKELERYGFSGNRIYTSDLSRAEETAEIIRDVLNGHRRREAQDSETQGTKAGKNPGVTVIPEPRLREMSLGEWDGRYISEIREEYPEEYKRRGEDLLTYKYGNDSENFYDLQYRVMKGFRSILKREREAGDGKGDIAVVSHSGVISVIISNLRHTDLKDEIGSRMPNGGVIVIDYSV